MGWKFIFLIALVVVGWIAYYLWNQIPETPKSQTLSGYTQALQNDLKKAERVASNANVENVQGAVNKYRSMKGASPASLQDMVPEFMDHIPGGLNYDPATGTVSASQ